MRPFVLLSSMLFAPAALAAQSHPLVGTWAVEVPAGMRMENGEATPIMAKGTFVFSVVGDSLIGTLKSEPLEGMPARPASRVAAKLATGTVTFVSRSEAKLNMGGEEITRTAVSTWIFDVSGDTLKGTVERAIEGVEMAMGGPQPITGKRAAP
jgi:hypothetical protein